MAQRARQLLGIAHQLEVDALLRRVEFNLGNTPRRSQPQTTGKHGFIFNGYLFRSLKYLNNRSSDLWITRKRVAHKIHRVLLHFIFEYKFNTKRRRIIYICRYIVLQIKLNSHQYHLPYKSLQSLFGGN